MDIIGLVDEDLVNYKKCSMVVMMPYCSFKCGEGLCQNSALAKASIIEVDEDILIRRYMENSLTSALIFSGLEPFDSFDEVFNMISRFRTLFLDDIVIYTGYNEEEISSYMAALTVYVNIIVKFGRFIPNQETHYDKILGINLASDNQYGKRIS